MTGKEFCDRMGKLEDLAARIVGNKDMKNEISEMLHDACNEIGHREYLNVSDKVVLEQLDFLVDEGYSIERLQKIVEGWE
jgi:hypothetical protein